MKWILSVILMLSLPFSSYADDKDCSHWPTLLKKSCKRLKQVWYEGHNELYLSGYAWHNRYTYDEERIKRYNEAAYGGGLGKGFYDEDGDWHGLYAIAFLDSHKNVQPVAGYAFLKVWHLDPNVSLGGGFSAFVTARPDIFNNIPFPGILPWASLTLKQFSISATYIPGAQGAGNVLYLLGKWTF